MGKMINILSLLITINFFSQERKNTIIEFDKNDSIRIEKKGKEYTIYIYFEENIEHNKSREKKIMVDNSIFCEECRAEYNVAIVEKPKKRIKNYKIIPAKEWKKEHNLHDMYPLDYLKIGDYYYKYIGTVIE
jgi:hypothetical protein